jgi:hypothetical protein
MNGEWAYSNFVKSFSDIIPVDYKKECDIKSDCDAFDVAEQNLGKT